MISRGWVKNGYRIVRLTKDSDAFYEHDFRLQQFSGEEFVKVW